jgi:hypothetical protein
MLFGTSLSFSSSKLLENVNTPAERIVVSCVLVELVEGRKLFVGNNEVYSIF